LEYLLIPLVFGLGAPLVALVGTNIGAGQPKRALRIAFVGAAIAFVMTEAIGVTAAIWPRAWLGLFGSDPGMLATGTAYLHVVGRLRLFRLGLCLYFASQGAGRLGWPLIAGFSAHVHRLAGGWLVLRATRLTAGVVRRTRFGDAHLRRAGDGRGRARFLVSRFPRSR